MEKLKDAVIFDLDGTLALTEHRSHFLEGETKDWRGFFAACDADLPNKPVIAAMRAHCHAGHRIYIVSGRSDEVKDKTSAWIIQHICPALPQDYPFGLIMRAEGNFTPDHILKGLWLDGGMIPSADEIICVYDDRKAVVDMWRSRGIACFQVAPGDF